MSKKLLRILATCLTITYLAISPLGLVAQESNCILDYLHQPLPNQGKVTIHQSQLLTNLLEEQIKVNASRPGMQGFRIRVYFDLGQDAANQSLQVANKFMEDYPGVPVYRTKELDSPYFKVTVGDFRSRDDALRLHKRLQRSYPKAFIIPEWINFPILYQ